MGPVDLHLTSSPNGSDIFVLQNIMLNRDCCIQQGRGESVFDRCPICYWRSVEK